MTAPGTLLAALACAVALAGFVAGCSSGSATDASLTVYLSAPSSGPDGREGRELISGARSALATAGGEAAGHPVTLVALDSAVDPGAYGDAGAAANARTATADSTAIAYIGEIDRTTRSTLPITRAAGLLQVEPDGRSGGELMRSVLTAIGDAGDPLDRSSVADAYGDPG